MKRYEQRTFFIFIYLFIYLFIYFYLFIYLFFARHFLKPLKFVWGVPKWKFLRGKNQEMGKFSNLAHL